MDYKEWKRLTDRKAVLNTIFTKARPSDFNHEEWQEMYKEFDEINEKLCDPKDQSAQERNHMDPLYGKD